MADDILQDAPRTIVVVGGGQAAGWIVKTLRKEGFEGRLVMIADEIHLPYERPPLSKAVLSGDADIDTVRLVSPTTSPRSTSKRGSRTARHRSTAKRASCARRAVARCTTTAS